MRMRWLMLFGMASCDDGRDPPPCASLVDLLELDAGERNSCSAAQRFASRVSTRITVADDEVRPFFQKWRAIVDAEPILTNRVPQLYRHDAVGIVTVLTENSEVIVGWDRGEVVTGNPAVDAVIAQLDEPTVFTASMSGVGGYAVLHTRRAFNEEILHAALTSAEPTTRLSEPFIAPKDDGSWTPGEDFDTVDFTFGWGDCLNGCLGFRHLRATVTPLLETQVYDMGGDPLPEGMALSPMTIPWPTE